MLNPEYKSALKNNAIVKKDEYSCKSQNQVGAALFVFGEAFWDFLRPDSQRSLDAEARLAVAKFKDGVKMADPFLLSLPIQESTD